MRQGAVMANPYREGKGWAIRARHQGQEIYRI